MHSHPFRYRRAGSLADASRWLAADEDARPLAGGQSLVPLMKLRLARPSLLVDLTSIPGLDFVRAERERVSLGPLACHAIIAQATAEDGLSMLHDCAAGIADVQVRNRGTIGGSLAEADPSGDWPTALMALDAEVRCAGPDGERTLAVGDFLRDAYTTALLPGELVTAIIVRRPSGKSGTAYVAFKRTAPVYATASAAVTLECDQRGSCRRARIVLGCLALRPWRAASAEAALRGRPLTDAALAAAADAAAAESDPPADTRGSKDYKRLLARALVLRGLQTALARSRGEAVEISHEYVGR